MKKNLVSSILVILLLCTSVLSPGAHAIVSQSEDYYVADYAAVLSERTKTDIIESNIDLEYQCNGAQIVIVTVEYLGGIPSDEYATSLFNDWGVGSLEGGNNGMLLLLATQEPKGWLVVGAGISHVFTDQMAEDYLNWYFWDEVDARNYDTAVRNICEALFSWYASYYELDQSGNAIQVQPGLPQPVLPEQPMQPVQPGFPQPIQPAPDIYVNAPNQNTQQYRSSFDRQYTSMLGIFWLFVIISLISMLFSAARADRNRHTMYYRSMGMPIPPYHWWFIWGPRPHRTWYNNSWRGPRGPGGGGGTPPRNSGGSGRSGGSSGSGGSGGRSGGGFGGFGGSSGGSSGGFSGGGSSGGSGGGGGGFSGGGGGRR